jgi:hypothetical protein
MRVSSEALAKEDWSFGGFRPTAGATGACPWGSTGRFWHLEFAATPQSALYIEIFLFSFQKEGCLMLVPGTAVTMTKGYKDLRGVISYRTDSKFEIYVITLTTGMKVAAGPSSFTVVKK